MNNLTKLNLKSITFGFGILAVLAFSFMAFSTTASAEGGMNYFHSTYSNNYIPSYNNQSRHFQTQYNPAPINYTYSNYGYYGGNSTYYNNGGGYQQMYNQTYNNNYGNNNGYYSRNSTYYNNGGGYQQMYNQTYNNNYGNYYGNNNGFYSTNHSEGGMNYVYR